MQLQLDSTSQLETNGLSVLLLSLFAGEESVDDGFSVGSNSLHKSSSSSSERERVRKSETEREREGMRIIIRVLCQYPASCDPNEVRIFNEDQLVCNVEGAALGKLRGFVQVSFD